MITRRRVIAAGAGLLAGAAVAVGAKSVATSVVKSLYGKPSFFRGVAMRAGATTTTQDAVIKAAARLFPKKLPGKVTIVRHAGIKAAAAVPPTGSIQRLALGLTKWAGKDTAPVRKGLRQMGRAFQRTILEQTGAKIPVRKLMGRKTMIVQPAFNPAANSLLERFMGSPFALSHELGHATRPMGLLGRIAYKFTPYRMVEEARATFHGARITRKAGGSWGEIGAGTVLNLGSHIGHTPTRYTLGAGAGYGTYKAIDYKKKRKRA